MTKKTIKILIIVIIVVILVLFFYPKNLTKLRVASTGENGKMIEKIEQYICSGIKYEGKKDKCVYYNCSYHYCFGITFGINYFVIVDGVIEPINSENLYY